MYRWIKLSNETQSAAKWCARRNYDSSSGTPLPFGISTTAFQEIANNPQRFKLAVHIYKSFARRFELETKLLDCKDQNNV
jgi:hypothetical protein